MTSQTREPTAFPAATPKPPYYAVIFSSIRTDADDGSYAVAAESHDGTGPRTAGVPRRRKRPRSVRRRDHDFVLGEPRRDPPLAVAHRASHCSGGRPERWYAAYRLRVARVEGEAVFDRES